MIAREITKCSLTPAMKNWLARPALLIINKEIKGTKNIKQW